MSAPFEDAADSAPRPAAGAEGRSAPQERFERIVREFGRLIGAAVVRVGGRALRFKEDIEQRVLLSIWRQVERDRPIEYPVAYIYKAAVREAVRILEEEEDARDLDALGRAPARHGDPHEALVRNEWIDRFEALLDALPPERARAVRAHLSGFDVREIMEMYGWPYHKARNLIARGMADLRAALRKQGIHG